MPSPSLSVHEIMRELQTLGTAQNMKIFKRHGSGENVFGVSFANLNALKKRIKTNHALALDLWATKNTDARTLATMIADPHHADERLLEEWVHDIGYYMLVDVFVTNVASQTPFLRQKMEEWVASPDEWVARAGWHLLARLAMSSQQLPETYFERYLDVIERDIHQSKNRSKDAMNNALIAIGIRNAALKEKAIATATRIGKVDVDHGETWCKTPSAVPYIEKAFARKLQHTQP